MIAQIWIALFGLTSSLLQYSTNNRIRRWAPVLAVIAQPAWYWSCISAHQWGVLVLSFFYTCIHVRGLWKLWNLRVPREEVIIYDPVVPRATAKYTFVVDERAGAIVGGRCPCGAKLAGDGRCPNEASRW